MTNYQIINEHDLIPCKYPFSALSSSFPAKRNRWKYNNMMLFKERRDCYFLMLLMMMILMMLTMMTMMVKMTAIIIQSNVVNLVYNMT